MKTERKINEHQAVMLEMLTDVDKICKKHNIKYQLFAGSLLGAVRHKGFIPWDDDLDIVMLRPEYERFLQIAPSELDTKKYFLQKEFSEHWPMFFSKLRKNGTACIERQIPKDKLMHQGVYIDIFPCDNLSDNAVTRRLQFFASKVVIAKSLDRRGYLTDNTAKKIFIGICRSIPQRKLVKFVKMSGKTNSKMVHTFFGGASRYEKNIYPREWLSETKETEFEERKFPISAHYDEVLTKLYGNYMVPLPEEKRGCKVHGEIVDLEHSYEEYSGIQKTMSFKEYTRSIR